MRWIQAFNIGSAKLDKYSAILDWLLSPKYFNFSKSNDDKLILYTNQKSIEEVGKLWDIIKSEYDEIYLDVPEKSEIFSSPKFYAAEQELNRKPFEKFIIIDLDLYIFKNLNLTNSIKAAFYEKEDYAKFYYKALLNNYEKFLGAPEWFNWDTDPFNCSILYISTKDLWKKYLTLYNQIDVKKIPTTSNQIAIIKEQLSLGGLLEYLNIKPKEYKQDKLVFHKGEHKKTLAPKLMIQIQRYLLGKINKKELELFDEICPEIEKKYDGKHLMHLFLAPYEEHGLLSIVEDKEN